MDNKSKICGICKQITNFDDFKKNKQRKDGIGSWCKKCNNLKQMFALFAMVILQIYIN